MITFKSGRKVFFENIVSVKQEGSTLILELSNKERIQLKSLSEEEFLKQRRDYFAELAAQGEITKDFGLKVVDQLSSELETAITTLQTATIAYETSAALANTASTTLANTSDRVDVAADKIFTEAKSTANKAAERFERDINNSAQNLKEVTRGKIFKAAEDLQNLIGKLSAELDYLED